MIEFTRFPYKYKLNKHQITIINDLIKDANFVYPRLSVLRFDLRYPNSADFSEDHIERDAPCSVLKEDLNTMKRFFRSLREQVANYIDGKRQKSNYAPHTEVFYVWKREASAGGNKEHYHVAIFVNKDVFWIKGKIDIFRALAEMIQLAWLSAIGLDKSGYRGAVYFPRGCRYELNKNRYHYERDLENLRFRLHYFAKEETSVKANGKRSLGYSTSAKKMAKEKLRVLKEKGLI